MVRTRKNVSYEQVTLAGVASLICGLTLLFTFIPSANATLVPSSFAREATVLRSSRDAAAEPVADLPKKTPLYLGSPTMAQGGWSYVLYDSGTEIRSGYIRITSLGGVGESMIDQAAVSGRAKSADVTIEQVRIEPKALEMKCSRSDDDTSTRACAFHYILNVVAPTHYSGYVRARCAGTLVLSPNADIESTRSFPHTHDSVIPVGNGIGFAIEVVPLERSIVKELPRRRPSSSFACIVGEVFQ